MPLAHPSKYLSFHHFVGLVEWVLDARRVIYRRDWVKSPLASTGPRDWRSAPHG